jgi:hypothetical protein
LPLLQIPDGGTNEAGDWNHDLANHADHLKHFSCRYCADLLGRGDRASLHPGEGVECEEADDGCADTDGPRQLCADVQQVAEKATGLPTHCHSLMLGVHDTDGQQCR